MNLEDQIAQVTNPQEFTRLVNSVFTEKYGSDYQVIDGTRNDGGNDGYIISEKRILAIYCPIKPERQTDKKYLEKILSDLVKAENLHNQGKYEVENWTFIIPRKLSNDVLSEMIKEAKKKNINANHKESTFIANELSRNTHLLRLFPFFYI